MVQKKIILKGEREKKGTQNRWDKYKMSSNMVNLNDNSQNRLKGKTSLEIKKEIS